MNSETAAPSPVASLRRRLGRLRKTRMMVRELRREILAQRKSQAAMRAELDRLAKETARVSAWVSEFAPKVTPYVKASDLRALEHGRFSLQLGAIEERLGSLEQQVSAPQPTGDDAQLREARSIVELVQREHAQIRARMQIVSAYEERLRRVEETCAELYDGDARHQV